MEEPSNDDSFGVAVAGDIVYVAGHTLSVGAGSYDALLIKYDSDGNQLWNTTWGGASPDYGKAVVVGSDGVYLAGYTDSFGAGYTDAFVTKYDSNGNQLWNTTWGGGWNPEHIYGTALSGDRIYVVGKTYSFGAGRYDAFLIEYDSDGNQLWNTTWGGEYHEHGLGVAVSGYDIYVSGQTESFGEGYSGWPDAFLVKYVRTGADTPWQDDTFCFIAYGDTRANSPGNVSSLHEEIVSRYLEHDPELILHTGDLVWHGGEYYQYADFDDSIQLIRDYEVPFFTAVGNHEMYTDDWVNDPTFTNYTAYVDYSDVAAACGGTELYYSFDANGIHIIFLNTEHDWDNDEYTCSAEQYAWLESELEATEEDDFVVLVFHRPPYSIRYDRPDRWAEAASIREEFHSLFVAHGVDLVFNGHDHLYYRTIRDGICYVVTGGGGAELALYQTEGTVWQEGDVAFSDYHYCVAKYESGFLNVDALLLNGTVRDSFSLLLNPQAGDDWNVSLIVDVGGYDSRAIFGVRENATVGFDEAVGDQVTPPGFTGVEAYFWYPNNPTSPADFRKLSKSYHPIEYPINWTLKIHTFSDTSGNTTLRWNSTDLEGIPSNYSVTLYTHTQDVDMRTAHSFSWESTEESTYFFTILVSAEVEFTLELKAGWNMVSLPISPDNPLSASIVLGDIGFYQLVTWSGSGYYSLSGFEAGQGYWLLVLEDVNVTISGPPVDSLNLSLSTGWSMIGGTYDEVQAADVIPGFYQLVTWTGTGYTPATAFEPGRGYWALVLKNTEIELQPN